MSEFMIGCDRCDRWFHGRCAGVCQEQAEAAEAWHCSSCDAAISREVRACVDKLCTRVERDARAPLLKLPAPERKKVEAAVAWLEGHQDDEGLDEPLLLPPVQPLSAQEAKAKAEELVARAKARREAEEAQLEKDREKMRVRMGREIQEAQRIEKEQAFARRAEERQREKEEEERARAKIRAKLEEDRRERRRKLGLPEEETEEEQAARRDREAAKAREAAEKQASNPNRPALRAVALQERLRTCLVQVKKEHGEGSAVCFQTLLKYAGNIAGAPAEEKYRRIKKANAAFSQRVAAFGGDAFLRALGFEDDGEFLFLPGDKVDRAALQAAGTELSSAISNPFFGVL